MSGSPVAIHERLHDDPAAAASALADEVAATLATGIEARGRASLVVSGGSTPLPFFRELRERSLPWTELVVTLADDRWVPPDHERSNERLVRRELLAGDAGRARFVPLVGDGAPTEPEPGVEAAERRLAEIARPFDVVVLGMGADGHTASLFPGVPETMAALDPRSERTCVAVRPGGGLEPRISLTLAALADARRVFLHVTGEEKRRVYRSAVEGTAADLPIAAVMAAASRPVEVHWAP